MAVDRRWPVEPGAVSAEQRRLAALRPPAWDPPRGALAVAAAVVVTGRGAGEQDASQPAWAGAVVLRGARVLATGVVAGVVRTPYVPALLAAREGSLLAAAVEALGRRPDVLLLAATGRDHPRGAGLALHLGALLDLPSVGVTDRPLLGQGPEPSLGRGDAAAVLLGGAEVARRVRTVSGVRPLVVHAAWRTTPAVAADIVLATTAGLRTPEPLRLARRLARSSRGSEQPG